MKLEAAQTLALQALAWIAGNEYMLEGLLAQTGIDPDDLRASADDPQVLAGVLDYLLEDERRLLSFCDAASLSPDQPARARQALPGANLGWD